MTNNGIVNIHGKQYVTVAKRLQDFHKDIAGLNTSVSIETEVLQHEPTVVVKATVKYSDKVFTGISSANPDKAIEKSSPYEVAETSAVGRALAFAGYETELGIASAEEVNKATNQEQSKPKIVYATPSQVSKISILLKEKGQSDQSLKAKYKVQSKKDLPIGIASNIIDNLMKLPDINEIPERQINDR